MFDNFKQWFGFEARGLLRRVPHPKDLHFSELLLGKYERKGNFKLLAPLFPENQYGLSVCSFEAGANQNAVYWGYPISVRWLVAKARQMGWCNNKGEAQLKACADVARKFGIISENHLPSDETMSFNDFVNIDLSKYEKVASENKVGSYYWCDTPNDIYRALDQGYPVVVGRYWTGKFDTGYVLNPDRKSNSAHATLVVGYKGNNFIELNSYGTNWGDKGFFYVPYEQMQGDINDFGAIAITPIPYTPKELQINAWQAQINYIMGLIQGYKVRDKFYKTALSFYRAGTIMSPGNIFLGCGYAMDKIWNTAFPNDKVNLGGTGPWWEYMKKSDKWLEILEPEPDCIIVYPTPAIPSQSKLDNGHIFLCGRNKAPDDSYWTLSNNSTTGKLDAHWTVKSAHDYYHGYGKIPRFCFRLLK